MTEQAILKAKHHAKIYRLCERLKKSLTQPLALQYIAKLSDYHCDMANRWRQVA